MAAGNLCLACGACCASFRVSFYWSEAYDAATGTVPPEITRHVAPLLCAMIGTDQPPRRCVALQGSIGIATWCAIYERRPTVCREFEPVHPDGAANPLCERARQFWGLPPLVESSGGQDENGGEGTLGLRENHAWDRRKEV